MKKKIDWTRPIQGYVVGNPEFKYQCALLPWKCDSHPSYKNVIAVKTEISHVRPTIYLVDDFGESDGNFRVENIPRIVKKYRAMNKGGCVGYICDSIQSAVNSLYQCYPPNSLYQGYPPQYQGYPPQKRGECSIIIVGDYDLDLQEVTSWKVEPYNPQ